MGGEVDELADEVNWLHHKAPFVGNADRNVVFRNRLMLRHLRALDVPVVVNLASLYGWLEDRLAAARPDMRVYGSDRSPEVERMNAREFARPNPTFLTGGVFGLMDTKPEIMVGPAGLEPATKPL